MLSVVRSRGRWQLSRMAQASAARTFAFSANAKQEVKKTADVASVSKTSELSSESLHKDEALQEDLEVGDRFGVMQAPNKASIWSRSQNPRGLAMTGPRFEQTIMEDQPAPEAAISLVHQQPVRWTHKRSVECDGGGGPLGHPKIFINLDKPQICVCTYCGLPFANEHHRQHLESLPESSYPLEGQATPAEIP